MKHLHGTEGDEACRGTPRKGSFEGVCPDIVSVCLSLSPSVSKSVRPTVCLSSVYLSARLSVFQSVCPTISLSPIPSPRVSLPFMQSCNRLNCSLIIIAAAFGVGVGEKEQAILNPARVVYIT